MECWPPARRPYGSERIMGRKTEKIKFLKVFNSSKPIIPTFHYSNWGEAPKFVFDRKPCFFWRNFSLTHNLLFPNIPSFKSRFFSKDRLIKGFFIPDDEIFLKMRIKCHYLQK
jgi:hypothetical protein